jgi:hypothetical protein
MHGGAITVLLWSPTPSLKKKRKKAATVQMSRNIATVIMELPIFRQCYTHPQGLRANNA